MRNLNDGGFLCISKTRIFDKHDESLILLKRYLKILDELNFKSFVVFQYGLIYKIIALYNPTDKQINTIANGLKSLDDSYKAEILTEIDLNGVDIVHDDAPFSAGFSSIIITKEELKMMYYILTILSIIILLIVILIKRESIEYATGKRQWIQVICLAFLAGTNFMLLESELVFLLMRYLVQPLDSFYLGIIIFILCCGFGAL